MVFWIIVGIAVGYIFKGQIDVLVGKAVKKLKDKNHDDWSND